MNVAEKAELFALLALDEMGTSNWQDIFNHLRRRRYTTLDLDDRDFPSLQFDLLSNGYVMDVGGNFLLTDKGKRQLRFLCGQAGTGDATPSGHERIRDFRNRYDNDLRIETTSQPVTPSSGSFPAPNPQLIRQEKLLEEAGEVEPYRTLAKARRSRGGNYHVYVIRLSDEIKDKYPNKVSDYPNLAAVYVGQSFYPPTERFAQHKAGIHSSRYVREFGVELMPDLYETYNPLPSTKYAIKVEGALAEKLQRLGYTVFGGH